MNAFPQIIVGTYEEFVLGFKVEHAKHEDNKYKFIQNFATHSHQASIRCIATHGQLMASSGADEYINIYNMEEMEISSLIDYHNSTVTSLEFTPDGSFLITANQSGDIAIFRCSDWNLVKLWKKAHAHALGVTCLSSHPTGGLLMSIGGDNILRFWNLVKGRLAYAVNFSKYCSIGDSLNFVCWSPTGKYYGISLGKICKLFKTQTAVIIYETKTSSKITCTGFIKKSILGIGTEEGQFEIHSPIHKKLLLKKEISKFRIKCMSSFKHIFFDKLGRQKIQHYLAIADSKGLIKLFRVKKKGLNLDLEETCQVDCDCRITCLAIVHPKRIKEENEKINIKEKAKSNEISKQELNKEKNKKKKEKLSNLNGNEMENSSENFQTNKTEKSNTNKKKKKRKFLELENSSKICKKNLISNLKESNIQKKKKKIKLLKSCNLDGITK